jgi:succinyl-diaminopimelate desuccinylase
LSNAAIADRIEREIDANAETLLALCERLVAVNSVNPPGNTAAMADLVRRYLTESGVDAAIETVDAEAPNVVAGVAGALPGKHLVFNAHMDTMEAGDETAWSVDPFRATRRNGRLYGLGVGNMKGALAAMCFVIVLIAKHRSALAGRLTLTAVSDEVMFGERGAVHLLKQQPELRGDYLISGEGPGFMDLAVAEKGLLWFDLEVCGEGGHSSRALRGTSAVIKLAKLLGDLDALNGLQAGVPAELDGVFGGENGVGLNLSLNAGTIAGGTVRSQIAPRASARLDIRLPPGLTVAEVERRIREACAGRDDVKLTMVKAWDANWVGLDSRLVAEMRAAAAAVRSVFPRLVVRLPGSDARRWRALGVPAVCYGPQATLSAGIDEYAHTKDIVDCAKIYARAGLRLMEA